MAEPFEFSDVQAEHILDMQLSRLTRLGREQLESELAELRETIAELEAILADDARLRQVIRDEIIQLRDDFANERRSEITHDTGDIYIEALKAWQNHATGNSWVNREDTGGRWLHTKKTN